MSKTDYAHGILLCVLSFVSRLFEVREEEKKKKSLKYYHVLQRHRRENVSHVATEGASFGRNLHPSPSLLDQLY